MNCCNDFGECTCGMGKPSATPPRSCDALGVCQQSHPPCGGCCYTRHDTAAMTAPMASGPQPGLRLAPGVVEGYRTPFFGTAQQRRELRRWAEVVVLLLVVLAMVSTIAGIVVGAAS